MSIDYSTIAKSVLKTEIKYLNSLTETFNDQFNKAVQLICNKTGKIIIAGIGKSGIAARKIATSLSSVGASSIFLNAGEANHGDLGTISTKDIVIIISNSGISPELIGIIEYCKNISAPVISITGNKNSLLYKESNIQLLLPQFSEVALKVPSTSFTLTSVIGDAFVACVVEHNKVTPEQYKQYHPGGKIGISLTKVEEIMRTGSNLPLIRTGALMSEALILMTLKSLGCIVVVNNIENILGIITDGDLRRHMSSNLVDAQVDQVMTHSPKTIKSDTLISEALDYMNKKKITNLIVTKNQKVVGIVHIHDCLKLGLETVES
ncbi:MAG: KpsF/GutQ family sugar-phosphate isomerase [Rickettsiales bacterium]|nr:KpsF/GutQ family sugar-phosphate isomerase [Rickettsiales bacterium]